MVRSVLGVPGVARLIGASLVGRIPAGALGLLLIVLVRELGGGYADGGLAGGAFALGLAAAAPLLGRVDDARGQSRVLAARTAACAASLVALALMPAGVALGVPLGLAALAGATHPRSVRACARCGPRCCPTRPSAHAAFALESSALELSYIAPGRPGAAPRRAPRDAGGDRRPPPRRARTVGAGRAPRRGRPRVAPVFAVLYHLAGGVPREGTVTEAFTWLGTGIALGLAVGSAAGGALAAAGGARAGFSPPRAAPGWPRSSR